jgi:hypothetical protein
VSLDIAGSNLSYPAQILFLGLHAVGVIIGLAYNSKTPDLYPNSAHGKLDGALTAFVLMVFASRMLRSSVRPRTKGRDHTRHGRQKVIPLSTIVEEHIDFQGILLSVLTYYGILGQVDLPQTTRTLRLCSILGSLIMR